MVYNPDWGPVGHLETPYGHGIGRGQITGALVRSNYVLSMRRAGLSEGGLFLYGQERFVLQSALRRIVLKRNCVILK